ncbi:nucleotidyltransferase domain-containing protein [candidate division KSB1 bacterium]|nr:nucleotidyltransferase domain-containing protein [candidate division KSB1 bacterium]MBL7095289.1 nucleotidyltransferase domain-containing protein [candidate division KSB1 bacterium]
MITIKEWKKKTTKATNLLNRVQKRVHTITPNADIIFYGSRVRGEAKKYSDWDFLILVDQPVDMNLTIKIRNSMYEIELETDEILSTIVRSKQEWYSPRYSVLPFKHNIEREGITL